MQKQRPIYSHPLRLGKSTLSAQKIINCRPKKRKTKSVRSINMETKTRLSLITLYLLTQTNLKPKLSRKTSIKKAAKRAILLLGLIPLRLPKKIKTRIKPKT